MSSRDIPEQPMPEQLETNIYKILDKDGAVLFVGYRNCQYLDGMLKQYKKMHPDISVERIESIEIFKYTNKSQVLARRDLHIANLKPANIGIVYQPIIRKFMRKLHQLGEDTAHIPSAELDPYIKQALSILK